MKGSFLLLMAGIFEIGFAFFLKESAGLRKLAPSIAFSICSLFSLLFLAKAVQQMPISIAYPIWVSIGIVGATVLGAIRFNEQLSAAKISLILVISVAAVVLTHLSSKN